MATIRTRLDKRFQTLLEAETDISWKDPNSENYDRQWAEDALFHTMGPLTDNPRWVEERIDRDTGKPKPAWTSPSEPVPGFNPGGAAPHWTSEEVVFAFAGDPNLLFTASGNPRSPMYGNKGGSPLLRTARKVARHYARANDRQFIADLFSNGLIPLMRMMKPGFDEGRTGFISYAIRNVQSAMEHGTGGTTQSKLATGHESEHGGVGLNGLLNRTDPEEVRALAQQIQGKYQELSSHDKHPDNPFGKYSAAYFQIANQYADALESGDQDQIEITRNQIQQQITDIKDENVQILGASTGVGQAISTPDRKTSINIGSMDVSRKTSGGDDGFGMAGNIVGDVDEESAIDPETITKIYDIAINHDLGDIIGKIPRYRDMAAEWGAKGGKIGGQMTVNELRYSIRTMGPLGSNYPGRGTVRANPDIPRDSRGWWEPGSDPEIEPIPNGAQGTLWHSIWSRNDYQSMGPTEISAEMAEEIAEFNKLGIQTARTVKTKIDKRSGREIQQAVSKVAVANTLKAATIKLKFIAMLERESLGLGDERTTKRAQEQELEKKQQKDIRIQNAQKRQRDIEARVKEPEEPEEKSEENDDSKNESKQKSHPLLESIARTDTIDRELIAEACDFAVARIEQVLNEVSPPGWAGSVKAMKKHEDIDNPYALAWSMKKKGAKPHYKDEESSVSDNEPEKKKEYANEHKMQPIDSIMFEENPFADDEEEPEDSKEESKAEEEPEKSPIELAAWDATEAMVNAVGNPSKGLP